MAIRELHLELLLGKQVLDSTGKPVGRIEEVRAEKQGDEWVIQEYLIGSAALLERLSAWTIGLKILHLLGARKIYDGYRVPWDTLDLTDPDRPRLCCTLQELNKLD
jgi:sporulation protein YlmC with PRC-barrel domain